MPTQPNHVKTILCLANSRKVSGRCIAGKETTNGKLGAWIRPVSERPNGEISEEERRFENGSDPKVLDVIEIPIVGTHAHLFQKENHLIDRRFYWSFNRRASWQEVFDAVEVQPLWQKSNSSYNGINDRIRELAAPNVQQSLRFIEIENLVITVAVEGADFGDGRRKVRGKFMHAGVNYHLAVTDPTWERAYLNKSNGEFPVGRAFLCVSLGEPWDGWVYKLIASVILPES